MTGFDASKVAPMGSREVLPRGDYLAVIAGAMRKKTKAGNGHYLAVEFQIIQEGEHKGRKLWTNLNFDNPNLAAVGMAEAELSSICHATDVMDLPDIWDLSMMADKPLMLTVGVNEDGYNGEPENTIKNYDVAPLTGNGFSTPPMGKITPVDEDDGLPF